MTPEDERQQRRGHEAQRWLGDPLFIEAREAVYGQLRSARQAASTTDTALHSKLILAEQVADRFFGFFEQLAETGRIADLWAEQERARELGFKDRIASYLSLGRNAL